MLSYNSIKNNLFVVLAVLSFAIVSSAVSQELNVNRCQEIGALLKKLTSSNNDPLFIAGLYRDLGVCRARGLGGEKNVTEAMQLLKKATALGDNPAPHILASLQLYISGDKSENLEGFRFFLDKYKRGSKFAAGKLGWAYHLGKGVEKDDTKALEFYEIAAKGGMTLWQYLLAHVYEEGYYGVKPNLGKMKFWIGYQPKVQDYNYACAIFDLYQAGASFPNNKEVEEKYKILCKNAKRK